MKQGFKCLKANGNHPKPYPPPCAKPTILPRVAARFACGNARDRNDEILERICIDRRFKNDTVHVALRSKTFGKTLRAIYQNGHPTILAEKVR
jgi:hypothetical protein